MRVHAHYVLLKSSPLNHLQYTAQHVAFALKEMLRITPLAQVTPGITFVYLVTMMYAQRMLKWRARRIPSQDWREGEMMRRQRKR